jgi:chromosome segregation ATPase
MDSRDDITIEILKDIREEIRGSNRRIDGTNQRIDHLEQRLDSRIDEVGQRVDRLEYRVTEGEVRIATAITDMHGTLLQVRDVLRDRLDLRGPL